MAFYEGIISGQDEQISTADNGEVQGNMLSRGHTSEATDDGRIILLSSLDGSGLLETKEVNREQEEISSVEGREVS